MNKKSFAISILSAVLLVSLTILPTAEAQPSQQVLDAIAKGVEWLAAQQNSDGSWGTWEVCAVTVLATKKLEHHAVDPEYGLGLPSPFDENFAFREHVGKGLGHLFSNCAQIRDISVQTAGNPDTNGNGKGIAFGVGSREMYDTGVALMTICEAVELDRTIESGPLAGKTYEQVARDTMDYLVFGQGDSGDDRGGWGYMAINNNTTDGWTDNSNSGYVTLGLGYAQAPRPEGCGFELPQFVKNGLDYWIKTMQDPVNGDSDDGGSWYSLDYIFNPSWVNLLKTGNLLQQMALYGDSVVTQRVKDALGYVCRHWSDANQDPGWMGWPGGAANYQATFALMKGLVALGLKGKTICDPAIDWQTQFEEKLLADQEDDGSWPQTYWDSGPYYGDPPILSTTWALLTLQKAAPVVKIEVPVDIKPGSCPNPISVKSKGVVPVAIARTDALDVTKIDPASVRLSREGVVDTEVAPLRWSIEDAATPFAGELCGCHALYGDGYIDLSLKFDMQALVVTLELGDVVGQTIPLTLTGNLKEEFGGTPITGQDCIRVQQ